MIKNGFIFIKYTDKQMKKSFGRQLLVLLFLFLAFSVLAGKGGGCTPPTKPTIDNATANVCPTSSNTYTVTNIVGGATYTWAFTGTGNLSTPNGTPNGTTTTLSNVTSSGKLAVQATNSCSSFTGIYIHTYNVPTPNAGANTSICSGGSTSIGTTGPTSINQVAFREDFAIPDLPGWVRNDAGGGAQWYLNLEYTPGAPGTTTAANGYMVVDSDRNNTSLANRYLTTPSIDFTYYTSVNFAMSHYYRFYNGSEYAKLEVSINGGSTWSALNTWTASTGNPDNYSVSVPSAVGQSNVKFRFNYYADYDWYWFVDDILITGNVPVTYAWSPTNGLSNAAIANPTASPTSTTTYTLTATAGNCTRSSNVTITVNPNQTISTPPISLNPCLNTPITTSTISTAGATGISNDGVSGANGLPAGVSATFSGNATAGTITISGTPTASGTFNYSIPLTGGCGTVSATGTIIVNPNNTTSNISPSFCVGAPLAANNTMTTTGATGIGTATGLPTGVTASWASNTITLSGTPSATGTFNYNIPLIGGCGTVSASGTITILASNQITGASSPSAICLGNSIATVNFSIGALTGINVTGLPAGVSSTSSSISGTPSVAGVFNYTIGSTEGCTATGTITVNGPNTITLTSASGTNNQQACRNSAITNVTYVTTATTGIQNSGVLGANGLPPGVSATWSANTVTISGTPTATGTYNYTITPTGVCGAATLATGTIYVNALPNISGVSTVATTCSNLNQSAVFTISGTSGTTVSYTLNGTPGTITLSSNTAQITIPSVTTTQTMVLTSVTNGTCAITPTGSAMTATTTVSSTCQPMTECNLAVLTIGNGSTTLSASSTAAFAQTVQERLVTDGNVTTVNWTSNFTDNTGSGGTNNLLTNEGNNNSTVSTGFINSYNGILGVPGYTSTVGTTTVSTTNTKALSLINGLSGTLQSRTVLSTTTPNPFNSLAFRSVIPVTSTTFYAAGSGNSGTGGIWYVDITNASSPVYTQLLSTTGNVRNLEIYNGTLYFSGTSISSNTGIFQLGTVGTLPTSGSPSVTPIITYSSGTPGGFAISPDGCNASASSIFYRGITKWSNSGGSWTRVGSNWSPQNASSQFSFAFGLVADFSGSVNKIYFTAGHVATPGLVSSQLIPNTLFGVQETGNSTTATWTPLFSVPAGSNYRFAGIDFSPNSYKPFNITTQPLSANTCVNTSTTLSVSTNYSGTVNYQWYKNTSSGSLCAAGWTPITNETNATLTFTPTTPGTEYYYVKVWTSCASVRISSVATVIIANTLPTVLTTLNSCVGSTATITVTASGATAPYNVSWNGTANGDPADPEIANSGESYTTPGLSSGSYNIIVTSANGCSTTFPTQITINCGSTCTNPTIDTQPTNITECVNAAQQLSVTASGTSLTYQWYSNTTNSTTGIDVTNLGSSNGAQTATYTPPSGSAVTFYYFVIVNSSTCATTSNAVTVVVNPANTAGPASSSTTVCLNAAIAPSITITTTGATGIGAATGLPTGVTAAWLGDVITISGTPSTVVGSPFSYSIPLTGGCGTVNATGTITVQTQPSIIFLSPP